MPTVGLFDDDDEERRRRRGDPFYQPGERVGGLPDAEDFSQGEPHGPPAQPTPGDRTTRLTNEDLNERSRQDLSFNPRDYIINRDQASWQRSIAEAMKAIGRNQFNDPDAAIQDALQGVQRQVSFAQNAGRDPADFIRDAVLQLKARASNRPAGSDEPPPAGGPTDRQIATNRFQPGAGTFSRTGTMFDDPGTSQLEQLLNRQLEALNKPNPQLTQLMDFLNKRFGELSTSQGYSPEELAILRTQAFEPIEQYRQATKRRNLERTAARGFLPTSGIADLQEGPSGLEPLDLAFDRMRVAADRDLAINNINERSNRLNQAMQLARAAFDIPVADERARFGDQLARSSLIYELPRNAMLDSLAVLDATPGPESLFNQSVRLQQLQQQRDFLNQQRNAQVWDSIGQILPSIFGLLD